MDENYSIQLYEDRKIRTAWKYVFLSRCMGTGESGQVPGIYEKGAY